MELKELLVASLDASTESNMGLNQYLMDSRENFKKAGFPGRRHEEWRYTDLSAVLDAGFSINHSEESSLPEEVLNKAGQVVPEAKKLVFVNGRFSESLSDFSPVNGLEILSFADAKNYCEWTSYLNRSAKYNPDGFNFLNGAFAANGLYINVKRGQYIDTPLLINHFSDARTENSLSLPRIFIHLEAGSRLSVTEQFLQTGNHVSLTNSITDVLMEEDASLHYYKLLDAGKGSYHVGTTQVNQVGKSVFNSGTFCFSGEIVRNNLNVTMEKAFSEAHLNGLTLLSGNSLTDNHTVVDHAVRDCQSNELYKSVLDGKSGTVFNGKIFVRQDAQKTNAYQSSKNVLLSKEAFANSKPQLEIFADDVKCSHGSTTGQLDKEALFYLKSRGIGEKEAYAMLTKAFANDVIRSIKNETLKYFLENIIDNRFF